MRRIESQDKIIKQSFKFKIDSSRERQFTNLSQYKDRLLDDEKERFDRSIEF